MSLLSAGRPATAVAGRPPHAARAPALVVLVGALLAAVLTGCSTEEPIAAGGVEQPPGPAPTLQPDDVVDLTVYFRNGSGADAYLEPVVREVPVEVDLPRTAVQLLAAGPEEEDGSLRPALPPDTVVHGVEMDGDTAVVDLSSDVLVDGHEVGASPESEVLALGAIANTLTEFPTITRVRLLVDGQEDGWRSGREIERFWGFWGLPEVLVRDESLIGAPREGDGVPDFEAFSDEPQEVGARDADPVRVTSLRARERTTYVRLILELADAHDVEALAAAPPVTKVRQRSDGIVLEVRDVAGVEVDALEAAQVADDPRGVQGVTISSDALPGTLRVVVDVEDETSYHLHTLSSPTRIVLDVRR